MGPDRDFRDPDGSPVGVFTSPEAEYRPRWWLHGLLFALTLAMTTFWGTFIGELPDWLTEVGIPAVLVHPRFIAEGLKFSLPLLAILTCHELGHYAACRGHNLRATPPFFIPFPLPIGTLGAIIRIKEPIRNRKQLMDVGAAGPIAGFVATIPLLVVGLALSRVENIADLNPEGLYYELGEPLLYRLLATLLHPDMPAGATLFLHPTAVAAWVGILVTLLNMLPFAQLDGGHVCYALFGRRHRKAAWPLLVVLIGLGFVWWGWWLWSLIVVILGVEHPPVWDDERPLGWRRAAIGWLALAVFVLCFMPVPIRIGP